MAHIWDDETFAEMVTLRHFDSDVGAVWMFYQEADDSLQIIYEIKDAPNHPGKSFCLYLSPHSAEIIGKLIMQWGQARK